jgi:hypothetical protein
MINLVSDAGGNPPASGMIDPMSNVARETPPEPYPAPPWPDSDLQDLFIEVVPELVDMARLAALATGEMDIAARLEARLPGPYGQDFIDALIAVVRHMFPLHRQGLIDALRRAEAEAAADAQRFGGNGG